MISNVKTLKATLARCETHLPMHCALSHSRGPRSMKRIHGAQRGMVILCVLACLAVVTTMALCNLQLALRGRAETRKHLILRQAELLSREGIERVQSQLASSTESFETQWQPSPAGSNSMQCVVTIQAERDQAGERWQIQSTARIVDPASPHRAYQRSEHIQLPLSPNDQSEKK